MIDTIVLMLKQGMFTILEPDRFSPSARGLLNASYRLGGRANMSCYQNPAPRELGNGIYKPRLTLTGRINKKHNFEITLRVELSLPKLLFGNNFDELTGSDFEAVIQKLQAVLKEMGVYVFEKNLINAPVSAIHYPKNIPLTDGSTPSMYIQDIQKANITQRLDCNQTDYRNGGQSFKIKANAYEVAFYDKLKELTKAKVSEKRVEEKDNVIQFNLFERVPAKKPFELLRMEVRLNQRWKIKQILGKIGLNIEPTFQNLFKDEVAKKVLHYYLDEIEACYPKTLYFKPKSQKDFIAQFVIDNPKASKRDVLAVLSFYYILEELNTREVRELLKHSRGNWYSLIKLMNGFCYPKDKPSSFGVIRNAINEFRPAKLVDFQDEMINNDKYKRGCN